MVASQAARASDRDRPSPRRPILSLRLGMSMSFMLASLRVLHIDIPGAPAVASRLSSRRPTNDLSATAETRHFAQPVAHSLTVAAGERP